MGKVLVGIDKGKNFRVFLADATDIAKEATSIHETNPIASVLLARVCTATAIMTKMLKSDDNKLTLQFKGDGPAREILATGYGSVDVKAYISSGDFYVDNISDALGIGELTVIKDIGLKEPYLGKIALATGEIAEDLTAYFFVSEQSNSSVLLGVSLDDDGNIVHSGGVIIQMLPGGDESCVSALEKFIETKPSITNVMSDISKKDKVLSDSGFIKEVFLEFFKDLDDEYRPSILDEYDVSWNCNCSKDVMEKALMTVGIEDLKDILNTDGHAELQCHFCRGKYDFKEEDLESIIRLLESN